MKKITRKKRVRKKIGTELPRVCVFRSLNHIYCQIIKNGETLLEADDFEVKKKGKKVDKAFEVGLIIAKKALEKKIEKVVFDRGSSLYHGRVKRLAEGARKGGLKF